MSDIRFDTKWAHADFGLIVAPYAIPQPEPQTNYIEIPGRDGALDLTEALGTVRFNDRTVPLIMYALAPFDSTVSLLAAYVHGRSRQIIFDRDPHYYYEGRVVITSVEKNEGYCAIELECRTRPYKYHQAMTTASQSVAGTAAITLTNDRMPVIPEVTVTAEMTIGYVIGGTTYTKTLAVGTHRVSSLVLFEGSTVVNVTGTGTITFSYREGAL